MIHIGSLDKRACNIGSGIVAANFRMSDAYDGAPHRSQEPHKNQDRPQDLWKYCFDEVEMLEGCRMMRRASVCFFRRQFQFAEVVDQQILFDLNSNKRLGNIDEYGKIYTESLAGSRARLK